MKYAKLFSFFALMMLSMSSIAQRPYTVEAQAKERARITKGAPIVFIGRPLQTEFYEVKSGMVYTSTIIQVLEVLRGGNMLKIGTVEMIDSFSVQSPELRQAAKRKFPTEFDGIYGYYFSDKSSYPPNREAAKSSNQIKLKPYRDTPDARVMVEQGMHGMIIGGLFMGWSSEIDLLDYINGLPDIRKQKAPVDYVSYPAIKYIDNRSGKNVDNYLLK